MLLLQPVVQRFANAGAGPQHDVVFGFSLQSEILGISCARYIGSARGRRETIFRTR
jgi:hypothetical protein